MFDWLLLINLVCGKLIFSVVCLVVYWLRAPFVTTMHDIIGQS